MVVVAHCARWSGGKERNAFATFYDIAGNGPNGDAFERLMCEPIQLRMVDESMITGVERV